MKLNLSQYLFALVLLCTIMFGFYQHTNGQDTVKVSIVSLQQEIGQREQQLQNHLQDIELRKRQADYLQGAIDALKGKLAEYQKLADTLKAK